ncbi:putative transcriptional regulatory protein [Escovopsis weberi]|uniref:Putative transcriptional regulatory protein n=1 Tax=Escovopsis weberi TaxID=150374 RepID=A0A0M8N2H8_ESCWE|nr:putative transcriptional regulatory protein [Escovopsis weberi]
MMCSLVTNQSGESRYTGSSSGFSIFSPKGIEWINSKTGDDSFRLMISHVSEDDHKWTNWKPEVFSHLFQRPIFRPLPPKEDALSLLSDYFTNFNCIIPLFYQPTFMHLVDRQYSPDPYPGTGWWASLNVALALAYRLRVMSGLDPAEEDEKGWDHLKNAMACFSELTMRSTDLLSVQALVGMALFLQGTPNPQPAYMLIASALRLAHSIGLHKKSTGFNLNPIEIEQRRRVFWIAYMLDKDVSLRSGQPPVQDDNDMSVEFPNFEDDDNGFIPLADGKGKMCYFKLLCEFSVIQGNVYQRMYSAKASRQSDGELLNTIGELDQQLEEWKDSIPIDFRPEHPIRASHTPLILNVVMLHFAYYNCLITVHRMSVQHGMWTSRLADYAAKGLNNPLDPEAKSDVKLMNLVVTFLSMLGHEAEQGGVHRMLGVCSEFCRVADSVIEKAESDNPSRRKRKNPDAQTSLKPAPTSPQPRPPEHLSPASAWASPYAPIGSSLAGSSSQAGSSPSLESMTFAHDHRAQSHETDFLGHFGLGMDGGGAAAAAGGMQPETPFGGSGIPQQPLVPPDLFALQMSLDWNWAEMSGGAYPSVENGNLDFSDPSLLHGSPRHQAR